MRRSIRVPRKKAGRQRELRKLGYDTEAEPAAHLPRGVRMGGDCRSASLMSKLFLVMEVLKLPSHPSHVGSNCW